MTLNEIIFLLLSFGVGILFCWLYFKYKYRNMPSVLELLDKSGALHKETKEAIEARRAEIKNKEEELNKLLFTLSKNFEDPKDNLH